MSSDVKMIDRVSSTAKDPVELLRMTATFSHLRQKAWLQSRADQNHKLHSITYYLYRTMENSLLWDKKYPEYG